MKIRLPADTRYFEQFGGVLCRLGRVLAKDAEVMINTKVVSLVYDHRDQEAVAFQMNGREYYFILSEIRIDGLADRLRRLSNFTVVK